ncbi:hypothetical protein V3C99_016205 [Haemonchus contortus]
MEATPTHSLFNIVQLGIGFFLNFFAFNSQGFIEEPVIESFADRRSINKHAGYYSLSIIYAVFTISNIVAAPIVRLLSPKWAMTLGALCYAAFQAGFLNVNEIYLYISSGVLGFGAAILWTGQGTYLTQNSSPTTSARNSALLWALSEGSLLGGGLFLFAVFHTSETTDNISDSTVHILYGVFTAVSILAALTLALLRVPPSIEKTNGEETQRCAFLGSTISLMFTKEMLLLAFVFAYSGIEQSFWTGVYPTCISFSQHLGTNTNSLLALNLIATGIGQTTAGLVFGILGDRTKKLGRDSVVFLGTVVHLLAFLLIFMNFPADSPLQKTSASGGLFEPSVVIALICGALLGFGDACWNTQIYSFLCDVYSDKSSEAFALFKFYQAGLSCAAFFYSSVLMLQWHLLILVTTSLIAAVCFFLSERLLFMSRAKEASITDYRL